MQPDNAHTTYRHNFAEQESYTLKFFLYFLQDNSDKLNVQNDWHHKSDFLQYIMQVYCETLYALMGTSEYVHNAEYFHE